MTVIRPVVNEGTTAYVTVSFYDKNGNLAAPSSATAKIHDLDTGQVIRSAAAITASSQVEVEITATENAIINRNKEREAHVLTVEAVYGSDDRLKDELEFDVKNLEYVP